MRPSSEQRLNSRTEYQDRGIFGDVSIISSLDAGQISYLKMKH